MILPHRSHSAGETADSYRWWVLLVTSIGALVSSLTSGTLVIALPDILRDLHTDLFALMWIVVGYTLVATVLVLNAGRIADMFGRAKTYTIGFAIFTVASVFCAIAADPVQLIAGRVVQGVGGAFLLANSAALVTDAFPRRELGRALGINAMVIGAGQILGPILGGVLTTFGWRAVFWFNLPIGLIGTVAAWRLLVEQAKPSASRSLDWAGSGLYLVGLMGLMTSLAFGGIYGWTTPWVIAGVLVFLVVTPVFLWVELHQPEPLLDLGLFRDRLYSMGNLTSLLNGIARNGVLFLLVFYLQGARGYDPVTAGLLTLSLDTPYWQLALWQLIIGAGSGLFASPNTSAVMGVVPPEKRGIGAGTRMMLTQTGFIVSIALAIGLVTSAMNPTVLVAIFSGAQVGGQGIDLQPFIGALHVAFGAGVVASLAGAVVSMMRGGHRSWTEDVAPTPT
jgi:MFS family permease